MKIHEYQAKQLLKQYGVPVPAGAGRVQPRRGARGGARRWAGASSSRARCIAAGAARRARSNWPTTPTTPKPIGKDLLGKTLFFAQAERRTSRSTGVLVEEAVDIDKEIYLAITQDRVRQRDVLIVSTKGGMDIEEVAHNNPADIAKLFIDPLLGLPDYACRQVLFDAKFDKALIGKTVPVPEGPVRRLCRHGRDAGRDQPAGHHQRRRRSSRATPSGTLTRTRCSGTPSSPRSRTSPRRTPSRRKRTGAASSMSGWKAATSASSATARAW